MPAPKLAIIGGTGLDELAGFARTEILTVETPYGPPSGPLQRGRLGEAELIFLARHGLEHDIPPHRINYRANLWALRDAGAGRVLAVAAVGGIHPRLAPGAIAVPGQIVDYTWGRAHSYFDGAPGPVEHVDFSEPYCDELRRAVLAAASAEGISVVAGGTYGVTQGPRLETAAEIDKLERDGCTMVGMTGMPEAALARELELCYATCAVVANAAAGRGGGKISMAEIEATLESAMRDVRRLLAATAIRLAG